MPSSSKFKSRNKIFITLLGDLALFVSILKAELHSTMNSRKIFLKLVYLSKLKLWQIKTHVSTCSPGRHNLLSVISCIVNWESISGSEVLSTDNAGVVHVKVHFCVSPHLGLVCHTLSTVETAVSDWSAAFTALWYQSIQNTVQI